MSWTWTQTDEFALAALRYRLVLARVSRTTNTRRRATLEARLDELRARLRALKRKGSR